MHAQIQVQICLNGEISMRNKQKDFPIRKQTNLVPKAKADNHALRPNGTINTQPQKRMRKGGDNHGSL